MDNTLTFNIGDETRPKVENLFVSSEPSFFYEVYEKALGLIAEILEQNSQYRKNEKDGLLFQERNNIIAFVGDRGTGKTSCMKTVYHTLPNKSNLQNANLNELHNRITGFNIVTLPTIDPSYFEERHKILDIIVAHMFETFQEQLKHKETNFYEQPECQRNNRQTLIHSFKKVKICLDTITKTPSASYDTIENLSEMANGIDLKDSIQNLINRYLDFFGGNVLAIAIDDLDLQIKYAYDMVEYMRKYLILPNVIILIGVKMSQLNDLMKQYYYQENKDLISTNRLTDTTENMAGRYLSKLIPFNQRIFIPSIGEHFDKEIKIYSKGDFVIEGTINTLVLNLIYIKTRYLFYNTENNPSLILPRNLRDLLNLISLLYHMDNISNEYEEKDNLKTQKNRLRFRNYFIDTWCCENLSAEMYAFIKELETLEASNINKRVIDFLLQLIPTETEILPKKHLESTVTYIANRGYNVSLGDVGYILDKLSNNYRIPYITKFVFALKTIYSFFLYKLFEEQKDNVEARVKYLQMQYYQVEDKNNYIKHIKKMTKLMIMPSYERLLGGNLIRIAKLEECFNDENRTSQTNKDPLVPIHQKIIKNELLNELNKYIMSQKTTDSFQNVPWEQALNIWEFFILTTYLNDKDPYFRSKKQCYYLPNPTAFPIDFENTIIYSSTVVLFNVVKLYDYFKLYNCQKKINTTIENKGDSKWDTFWDVILNSNEKSIIKKILCNKNKYDIEKYCFNDELEKIFIRNMEVLDILEDYLPFLKKKIKFSDSTIENYEKLIHPYTELYWRIAKFHFSLYPKNIDQVKANPTAYESISFGVLDVIPKFLITLKKDNNISARKLFCKIMFPETQNKESTHNH